MSLRDRIRNDYFDWLLDLVSMNDESSRNLSYRKLLIFLHDTKFRHRILKDKNRAEDGKNLRFRFAIRNGYEDDYESILDILGGPCSVLEMMVALAVHCEENLMDDPRFGDRTQQWFTEMLVSLGLGGMVDIRFDKDRAAEIIQRFLDREYEPNGRGGLFTIKSCKKDLRNVEIWYQLCWYLNSIT